MGLRYEAWTLPWSASFERKIARLPIVEGTGAGERRIISTGGEGKGDVELAKFGRLDDVVSATVGRLIRVYDGDDIVHEWRAERVGRQLSDETRFASIAGRNLASVFDQAIIHPYDYPNQPTRDPDFIWGSDRNILRNGGAEENPLELQNPGAEAGVREPWWPGAVEGVSANLTVVNDAVNAHSGSWFWRCTALLDEGGMSTSLPVTPGKTYTFTFWHKTASAGQTFQVGCHGHGDMSPVVGDNSVLVQATFGSTSFFDWEVQKNFTSTTTWQQISISFTAGAAQTSTQISIRDLTDTPTQSFDVDDMTWGGYGRGTDPWEPTDPILVTDFSTSQGVTAPEGSWVFIITSTVGRIQGVRQRIANVVPGAEYTATVKLRAQTTASRWVLRLEDINGILIGQTSALIGTAAFTTLTLTATIPENLPGFQNEIRFVVGLFDTSGTRTVYMDDARLFRGRPAATVGAIVVELMDDAAVDHAADTRGVVLGWVDYSSVTSTLDSKGTAWPSTISFTAWHGMSYGQVFDRLADLGYEWELVPKATPSAGKTHDLKWYIAGNLGTDHTVNPAPAITIRQAVISGEVVKRIPNYTAVLAEGAAGHYIETGDPTAAGNFGRLESYVRDTGLGSDVSLLALGAETLATEASNRTAVMVETIADDDQPRPLIDYQPGDVLPIQLPPALVKENRRIQAISYVNTVPERYRIVASRIFPGEAAAFELTRRLWRRFNPPLTGPDGEAISSDDRIATTGATGGAPTIVIAAADASSYSKGKADLFCDGVNDEVEVGAAVAAIATTGGEIIFTEGNYYFGDHVACSGSSVIEGVTYTFRGLGTAVIHQDYGGTLLQAIEPLFEIQSSGDQSKRHIWRFLNLEFDGAQKTMSVGIATRDPGTQGVKSAILVTGCTFRHFRAFCIYTRDGNGGWVFGNTFVDNTMTDIISGTGVQTGGIFNIDGFGPLVITDNHVRGGAGTILVRNLFNNVERIIIADNVFDGTMTFDPDASSAHYGNVRAYHNWVGSTFIAGDHDGVSSVGTTGTATLGGQVIWSGIISPAQITANQNDYNPTGLSGASTLRLSSDAARDITGLAGGATGRLIIIHNVGAFAITLKNQDAGSAAANRFLFPADIAIAADDSASLQYDGTSSRWRVVR